jgi:hypothetical protein
MTITFRTESTEWVGELLRCIEVRRDESHGMTLEDLIPETVDEWKRIRDEAVTKRNETSTAGIAR